MAFAIQVIKLREKKSCVYYRYIYRENVKSGIIKIIKKSGEVYLIEPAEGDVSGGYAERAGTALIRCWQKGEYPSETYYIA
jgi:hypothetical protein